MPNQFSMVLKLSFRRICFASVVKVQVKFCALQFASAILAIDLFNIHPEGVNACLVFDYFIFGFRLSGIFFIRRLKAVGISQACIIQVAFLIYRCFAIQFGIESNRDRGDVICCQFFLASGGKFDCPCAALGAIIGNGQCIVSILIKVNMRVGFNRQVCFAYAFPSKCLGHSIRQDILCKLINIAGNCSGNFPRYNITNRSIRCLAVNIFIFSVYTGFYLLFHTRLFVDNFDGIQKRILIGTTNGNGLIRIDGKLICCLAIHNVTLGCAVLDKAVSAGCKVRNVDHAITISCQQTSFRIYGSVAVRYRGGSNCYPFIARFALEIERCSFKRHFARFSIRSIIFAVLSQADTAVNRRVFGVCHNIIVPTSSIRIGHRNGNQEVCRFVYDLGRCTGFNDQVHANWHLAEHSLTLDTISTSRGRSKCNKLRVCIFCKCFFYSVLDVFILCFARNLNIALNFRQRLNRLHFHIRGACACIGRLHNISNLISSKGNTIQQFFRIWLIAFILIDGQATGSVRIDCGGDRSTFCHCWHGAQAEGQGGAQQACEKTLCFFHFSTSSLKKSHHRMGGGAARLRGFTSARRAVRGAAAGKRCRAARTVP